ncbi:hypothetical protein Rs2_08886 [Raphanus sativus]|nr:hypothetical protein Rs2_08886 [Raphanus sativus]
MEDNTDPSSSAFCGGWRLIQIHRRRLRFREMEAPKDPFSPACRRGVKALLCLAPPSFGVRSVYDGGALVGGRWKLSVGGLSGVENSGVAGRIVWSFAGGSEKSFGASRLREEMSIHFRSMVSPDERRSFSVVVVGDAGAGM